MKKLIVNNFEMAYLDEGFGTCVVFIHGFPFTHALWNPQIEALKGKFRVIVPDLRGFGESAGGVNEGRHSTMDDYADDVAALLAALEIEEAILVGLSMGGYVAFAFHRKYSEKIQALVLCDTRAEADSEEGKQNRYKLIENVQQQGAKAAVEAMLPKLFAPATYEAQPEVVAGIQKLIEENNPQGIINAAAALAERPDSTATLAQIRVPTLIMVGEHDQLTPPPLSQALADGLPGAVLITIPDAGHLSNLENPTEFNEHLTNFLHEIY